MEMNFQVLNHSNEIALSFPSGTSSYFLTINLLPCSAQIYFYLVSYHYSQLFWQFITANFMKQFQDLLKRKNKLFCVPMLKMPIYRTSHYCRTKDLWNSLFKYVKLLHNKVSARSFTHTNTHAYIPLCYFGYPSIITTS